MILTVDDEESSVFLEDEQVELVLPLLLSAPASDELIASGYTSWLFEIRDDWESLGSSQSDIIPTLPDARSLESKK